MVGEVMSLLDALLGNFRPWRRLRGGKWEHLVACCACPVETWERVHVFRPLHRPKVYQREDYR
jgi:hypothetical protein